jgi:hypothetical protein
MIEVFSDVIRVEFFLAVNETGHAEHGIAYDGTHPLKDFFGSPVGGKELRKPPMLLDIEDVIFKSQKGSQ